MNRNNKGFTLIELMLSMALFSMVLVIILSAFTYINGAYYRGISSAKVQESIRKISDDITSEVRNNGLELPTYQNYDDGKGLYNSTISVLCAGNSMYYFREGIQKPANTPVGNQQFAGVKISGATCSFPVDFSDAQAKINSLKITPGEPYSKNTSLIDGNISLHGVIYANGVLRMTALYGDPDPGNSQVVYNEDDKTKLTALVNDPSGAPKSVTIIKKIPRCNGGLNRGYQFCSVTTITTVLHNRKE